MIYNKPIIIAGQGIRLSNTIDKFKNFIENYNIPFVTSYLGKDLLPYDHPLNMGVMGIRGNKWANICTQNADLIIVLGCSLHTGQIGYNKEFLNDKAYFEQPNNILNWFNQFHLNASFIEYLNGNKLHKDHRRWINKCNKWKKEYAIIPKEYDDGIDIYKFMDVLSDNLKPDSVVVSDAGSAYFACAQALRLKYKQRWITSGAQADMGFALPAAIGISMARKKGEVICVTGEGSLQFNLQELQTIVHYNLPIKIFVLNNGGYLTIKNTQKNYFKRYIGCDEQSGTSFPDLEKISYSYGIQYAKIYCVRDMAYHINSVLGCNFNFITEMFLSSSQELLRGE